MNEPGMRMPYDSWVSLMLLKGMRKAVTPVSKILVRFGDRRTTAEIIATTNERYDELEEIVLEGVRRQNRVHLEKFRDWKVGDDVD